MFDADAGVDRRASAACRERRQQRGELVAVVVDAQGDRRRLDRGRATPRAHRRSGCRHARRPWPRRASRRRRRAGPRRRTRIAIASRLERTVICPVSSRSKAASSAACACGRVRPLTSTDPIETPGRILPSYACPKPTTAPRTSEHAEQRAAANRAAARPGRGTAKRRVISGPVTGRPRRSRSTPIGRRCRSRPDSRCGSRS